MRIGIYDASSSRHITGVQASVSVLAAGLRDAGKVEIVHHSPTLTAEDLIERYTVDLEGVRLRYLEREPFRRSSLPSRRYRQAREWLRSASEPYDLFVCFSHAVPPFCHARNGVLMVVFPLVKNNAPRSSPLRRWSRHAYEKWEWRRRMRSYRLKTANSAFSRYWSKARWGVDCDVVYAPADVSMSHTAASDTKENLILSVGRFAAGDVDKKQLEMMQVFSAMRGAGLEGWRYCSVGPLGRWGPAVRYFESVHLLANQCGAEALPNLERSRLRQLYASAKIFWHATGHGVDVRTEPERAEHFGIVTAEAMAAGCVPVVANVGGQPEIVEHGVSGFLWDSFEELRDYTLRLIDNDSLRSRMAEAARQRAKLFGHDSYVARFRAACVAAGVEGFAGRPVSERVDTRRAYARPLARAVSE